jgi:transcriptional regulator with XRE-family HTH domain
MKFGQKLRKLREEKGMSQQELAKRLGYKTNSYVSDMERGRFIPSYGKLRDIAKALRTPFSKLKDLVFESKLEEMGIKDPVFINLVRDYAYLTKQARRAIAKTYLKMKKRKEKKVGFERKRRCDNLLLDN